jgi:sulfhydrogenase subunit beta (sulfur reductase)
MPSHSPKVGDQVVIERENLQQLLDVLIRQGYQVVGPTVRDSAVVYDAVTSVADLPEGWADQQEAGTYRLQKSASKALFGYVSSPHSWKKFLYPPVLPFWQARRENGDFHITANDKEVPRFAFLGVRSCELHAIAIQDKVLTQGPYVDAAYQARRKNLFIVAVNCGQAGGTCFCASMGTGPKVTGGFDLALTEIVDANRHDFVAEVGTPRGAEVLREVTRRDATAADRQQAEQIAAETARHMGRSLDTTDLKELLYRNWDHPRWKDVASRCLTCANCTMVCPTCFCVTVEDVTDLTGTQAERRRKWDSCFTLDFSYIVGGNIRASAQSRYRQWLMHKLANWVDQFGSMGCVGCGRCITWCPVGIDIIQEATEIRQSEKTTLVKEQK